MGFTAIAKVIDIGGLSPEQKRKLKAVLVKRENKLKAAIADVEEALGRLGQKPKKSKKRRPRRVSVDLGCNACARYCVGCWSHPTGRRQLSCWRR